MVNVEDVMSFLVENKIIITLSFIFTGILALDFFTMNLITPFWSYYVVSPLQTLYVPLEFVVGTLLNPFDINPAYYSIIALTTSFLYTLAILFILKKAFSTVYESKYFSTILQLVAIAGFILILLSMTFEVAEWFSPNDDERVEPEENVTEDKLIVEQTSTGLETVRLNYSFYNNLSTDINNGTIVFPRCIKNISEKVSFQQNSFSAEQEEIVNGSLSIKQHNPKNTSYFCDIGVKYSEGTELIEQTRISFE